MGRNNMGDLFSPATVRLPSPRGEAVVQMKSLRLAVLSVINNIPKDQQPQVVIQSANEEFTFDEISELYNNLRGRRPDSAGQDPR
jgi:hypothetical protein